MGVNPDVAMIGMDRSIGLAGIANQRGFEVHDGGGARSFRNICSVHDTAACVWCPQIALADTLAIPLRTNSVDAVLSIAVLHHISTEARRVAALRELLRVLRLGGELLVSVRAACA